MRRIWLADLDSLPGVLTPLGRILEPVLERERGFPEVILANGVLVPGDELDSGELIDYGEIDVEIKGGVLLWEGWIQGLFYHACLVSDGKTGDDKEAGWEY